MRKIITFTFIFIIFYLIFDLSAYFIYRNKQIEQVKNTNFNLPNKYNYSLKYNKFDEAFANENFFRKTINFGINHKILIFGCSYAFGAQLDDTQTFGYKLAKETNSTVYNRSFSGWGLQHMLYIIRNKNKYLNIQDKNIDTIIYVYMDDHKNRLDNFYYASLFDNIFNIRYKLKNNKLKEQRIIFPIINTLFSTKALRENWTNLRKKQKNYDENTRKLKLIIFEEANKELKIEFPKATFYIIEYNGDTLKNSKKELERTGWNYLSTYDFIEKDISLNENDYHFLNDPHPTEKAWDVVVNRLIKSKELY